MQESDQANLEKQSMHESDIGQEIVISKTGSVGNQQVSAAPRKSSKQNVEDMIQQSKQNNIKNQKPNTTGVRDSKKEGNDQKNQVTAGQDGKNLPVAPQDQKGKANGVSVQDEQQTQVVSIGNYLIGKHLGKGTFGQVKLGQHTLTGEKVAIKILEKDKIHDQKDVERITREIKILKKVRHPNVIQLYEIIETEKELYMIMEFCNGGELFDYIVRHTRLSEKQACKFYLELISGIEYIHQSGVCHRDLKPENLLLDYDLTLKIVDFGLSNMYESGATLKTACGSPCYAAPEMIAGKRYHGLKTDIWSSGVVFYAMVCGYLPFEDPKTSNLYKKIMSAEYTLPKFLSSQCKDLIKRILNTDPEGRFSVNDIRNHTWSLQVKDKYRGMGLFPGKEKMPVEDKLFNKIVDEFNFDKKYAQKCIEDNRHNNITAVYHLIDRRNRKLKDREQNYQQTKMDFKLKMKIGTGKEDAPVDNLNRTVIIGPNSRRETDLNTSVNSPNPQTNQVQKVDLNMTAPIHSEQVKTGRRLINDYVGQPLSPNLVPNIKQRENSTDYQTMQAPMGKLSQNYQTNPNERIAANQRRVQTRGQAQVISQVEASKSPDKYTINKNLVVNLNDSVVKPVRRENSNTTHVTGITTSTAVTNPISNKTNAFYYTQYNQQGFFQQSTIQSSEAYDDRYKQVPPGTAGSVAESIQNQKGSRFRSIQNNPNSNNKQQIPSPPVNNQLAFDLANQNMASKQQNPAYNPNSQSIDIGQLPIRLVTQRTSQRQKNVNPNVQNTRNNVANTVVNGIIQMATPNQTIQPQVMNQTTYSKNTWQSIDASQINNVETTSLRTDGNQGLVIKPCSNQAQNLITGQPAILEIPRPSLVTPTTQAGGRSPRTGQTKNQLYAIAGRGINTQGNVQPPIYETSQPNGKGLLTKIFKNQQHTRQSTLQQQQLAYMETINNQGAINLNQRGGAQNIIRQLKSPNANIRDHLHTQGRARMHNQTLEAGQNLGNQQRGGSLNIQELYSHYQKNQLISNPGQSVQNAQRNLGQYNYATQFDQTQVITGPQQYPTQHRNNFMVGQTQNSSVPQTPGQNVANRFVNQPPRQNVGNNYTGLTAQQQKIFDMNSNQQPINQGAPTMAIAFQKNQLQIGGPGGILPKNMLGQQNQMVSNRKKISTQQQNRSHSVNAS